VKSTSRFALPYAEDSDTPNYPTQGKELADAVETALGYAGAQSKATIIATEESRTNAAYGTLTTPDKVEGIVLPTKGLICVAFQALWESSVAEAGRAAIFIGANQYKARVAGEKNPATMAAIADGAGTFSTLGSAGNLGLIGGNTEAAADVTTGQGIGVAARIIEAGAPSVVAPIEIGGAKAEFAYPTLGAATYIFAAAGTYDISVQFKSASGSVTAKNRRLYVWTQEFA
jgi:hypothetical protein